MKQYFKSLLKVFEDAIPFIFISIFGILAWGLMLSPIILAIYLGSVWYLFAYLVIVALIKPFVE